MKFKPRVKRKIRGLAGRKIVFEGFGRRAPSYLAIGTGRDSASAWISPAELRRLVAAAKEALR